MDAAEFEMREGEGGKRDVRKEGERDTELE